MQKKILLSLLMASPTTLPVFADINFGSGNWVPSGVSGENVSIEDGNVTCQISSGVTEWANIELMPGKYTLSFETVSNLQVQVINVTTGKTIAELENGKTSLEFEMQDAGDVTIQTKGIIAGQYSFTGANLKLNFDFEAAAATLQTAYDALPEYVAISDETFAGAKELLAEKATLVNDGNAIQEDIDKMIDPATTDKELQDIYDSLELYKEKSVVAANIEKLGDDIEAWNEKAEALNTAIKNTNDNTAAKDNLISEQKELLSNIDELIEKITKGSEYASKADLGAANDLKAEIEEYANAINTAYADDKLAGEITFASQANDFQTKIDNLESKWNADEADWNAYTTFMNTVYPELQNALDDNTEEISNLAGIEGYEGVFNGKKELATKEIEKTFNESKAKLNITSAEGAASHLADDQATVKQAKDDMAAVVTNLTDLVNTQNANATDAFAKIEEFNTEFEGYQSDNVPPTLKEDYDTAVADVTAKLNDLSDYVEGQYSKAELNLTAEDYTSKVAAVEEALSNLEEIAAPFAAINELIKAFDELKTYVKETSDEIKIVNIYAMFDKENGTFDSIEDAIKNLTTVAEVDAQQDAIKAAIKDGKDVADKLVTVFTDLQAAQAQYPVDVETLKNFVDNKVEIDASGKKAKVLKTQFMSATGEGGEFVAGQEEFETRLQAVIALANSNEKPQSVYDEAVAMQAKYVKPDGKSFKWQPELDEIMLAFAKQVTDSNKSYLDGILAGVKSYVAEGTYAGQDSIDFTEADQTLADIAADITAAATAEDPITAYGEVDDDIVEAIGSFDAIKETAKKYKQNQADYDALVESLKVPQKGIDNLIAQNDNESKDNGKEYFKNFINGGDKEPGDDEKEDNSLQGQLNKIQKDLDAALEAYANEKENVTGLYGTFESSIETLNGLITKTATDITNNNTAHTTQLNKAEDVAQAIVDALADLEEYYNNQEGISDWYDATSKTIVGLRDNDLFNNNLAVAQAYGNGQSYSENDKLIGEYDRILKEVETLTASMKTEYEKAVALANNATVGAVGWEASEQAMKDEYVSAISNFNAYYYGLNNAGWRAAVMEAISRHEVIYQYSQKINELIAKVNEYIKVANGTPKTFSEIEFRAVSTDLADALIAEMQAAVDAMNAEADAKAETYYNQLHGEAETQISGYETLLSDAGIPDTCLASVKAALTDAEGKYAKATGTDATQPLGLAMDKIADDLDKALVTIDLQPVAKAAWKAAYDAAKKTAEDILEAINDYDPANTDYKFADTKLRNQNAAKIADKYKDMVDLNTEVEGIDKDLIDSYAGYKEQLDALLDEINSLNDEVKDDSANDKANRDLYAELTGTVIPNLYDEYDALVEYMNSMAAGSEYDTDSIKSDIEALENEVKSSSNDLVSKKVDLDATIADITEAIGKGYRQAAYDEAKYLGYTEDEDNPKTSVLANLKEAFNDAKAAYLKNGESGVTSTVADEDQLNNWNNDIDKIAAEVQGLGTLLNPADFDKDKFQEEAQKLEGVMYDLYAELEQTWTGNNHPGTDPATEAKAELEKQYTEVEIAIAEAQDELNNSHPDLDTTEYQEALNNATAALEAEKADWESVGNRVIGMQPVYENALKDITDEVDSTMAALKDANDKAIKDADKREANESAYATLTEEMDALKAEYERVKDLVEEWYPGLYDGTLNNIESMLESSEETLETKYKAEELTASSVLPNGTTISNSINSLERVVMNKKANETSSEAYAAITAANNVLVQNNFVPEEEETLKSDLRDLRNDYSDNQLRQFGYDPETDSYDVSKVTVEVLKEVIEEYQRITTEAKSLEGTAKDQAYVPGDVDLNPDGIVTAADVQQIIRWVLEDMTWEELEAENPRQAYAADLNGDKQLNITDVTLDIAAMFGETPAGRRVARFGAPAMDLETAVNVEYIGETDGLHRYAISLTNGIPMIAGQLDLRLASGARIAGITTVERSASHELEMLESGFDLTRLVIYSMDNVEFNGNTGAILFVDVEGDGELKVENVKLTDTYFRTHEPGASDSTFINGIMDSAKEAGRRIYNAAGMMFDKLQKGINIIRDKDGKVTKQINRK